jgi:catechol 2,3-dioxygenase-like lactoylglutathione lyase family enzyme
MNGFQDFQHVTISVTNIDRSLAFYRDLLGFPVLGRLTYHNEVGLTIDFLEIGPGHLLEIFSFAAPTRPSAWMPNDLQTGLRHVGFRVNDVDATTARLKEAGVRFTLNPLDATGGVRIAFFEDPDGTLLEVIQGTLQYHLAGPAAGTMAPVQPTGDQLIFDHVAITVADLDRSLDFYVGLLDFPIIGQLFFNDERGFTITYLKAGTAVLELFSFSAPTIPAPWEPDETVLGLKHLGLWVNDVEAVAARLKAAEVPFIYEPSAALGGVKVAFFADPDGNALELIDGTCVYDA